MAAKHILVVESNAEDATLIRNALRDLPFCTAYLCRTLTEARSYLAQTGIFKDEENYPRPDAIVTEFLLLEDSAYELIVWIRGNAGARKTPIYLLVDELTEVDEQMLSNLALGAVIRKSTDATVFAEQLRQLATKVCSA